HARVREDPGVVVQADEVLRAGEDVHVVEAEPDHPHDGDQPHCGEADHLGRQEQIAETVPPVRAEGASRACGRGLRRGAHAESTSSFSRLDRDVGKNRENFAAFSRPVRWARKASAASCCVPALSATIEDWPTDWMSPAAPPGVGSTSHSKSAPSRSVLAPRKAVVLPAWPPQKSTC